MKAIKALVIGMSTLLLVGLVLLGYGIYRQAHIAPSGHAPTAGAGITAPAAGAVFGTVSVAIPAGARVTQMDNVGGRIVLRVEAVDGLRLVVLDPASGTVAGTFTLVPAAPTR